MSSIDPFRIPEGKRVAVIGGAGGIGRALVASLIGTGAKVAVLDLPASLARHAPPAGAAAHALDATDEDQVRAGFDALKMFGGALEGLLNLAGFAM